MGGSFSLADLMAYSLQLACLIALGVCVPPLLRITDARVRYGYSRTLLLACLLMPWLQRRPTVSVTIDAEPAFATVAEALPAVAAAGPVPAGFPWTAAIAAVFLAGVAIRGAWLSLGLYRLRRLRRIAAGSPRYEDVHELQRLLGTTADIRCVTGIGQPVTFGLIRPLILLPETLRDKPEHVQRAVVVHELIHVQQRDWAWVLAEEAVRTLLWFHPAVWWLISRVQLAREEAVDELAVVVTGTRRGYVEALLTFAGEPELVPVAAFTRRRHLLRRVRLISRESEMSIRRIVTSCLASAAVVAATGWSAVKAFPFEPHVERLQVPLSGAGLEREQQPVIPESMVPHRVSASDPEYPTRVNPGLGGIVDLAIALDRSGNVGDVRLARYTPIIADPDAPSATDRSEMAAAQEAFVTAATAAVRGWKYNPPSSGPMSVLVTFGFVHGRVTTVGQTGGTIAFPENQPQTPVRLPRLTPEWRMAAGTSALRPAPAPSVSEPVWRNALDLLSGAALQTQSPGQVVPAAPPPPPMPQSEVPRGTAAADPPDWPADALRVGGLVRPPKRATNVAPVYPAAALEARVQGVVIVRLLIERDGNVAGARILRSIPLLDQAALDAVTQWEFEPTLLNGQPVPLTYNVTVTFTLPTAPPPPPPPPPAQTLVPAAWPADAVRVGGTIRPPKKVFNVDPVYPPVAAAAQQQGVVIVRLMIDRDGQVAGAQILRSVPLLDQAALDAVLQWKFEPTLLNGQPVPVTYNVTVNFTLPRQ